MNNKQICIMLIGIPGSGKSYFIQHILYEMFPQLIQIKTVIASTDNYIERHAKSINKSYNDVFSDTIKPATKHLNSTVQDAIKNGLDIIWDQTNMTAGARKNKLNMIPNTYEKIALVFLPPEVEEHIKRLNSRPGKNIPQHVIDSMIKNFEMPTKQEGFTEIKIVD